MKFIVSSAELLKRLSNINGVITTNPVVPILENFLFEINDGLLTITASDLQTSMITEIDVEAKEDGSIAVPARILMDTLKNLPEQPVTFTIDSETYSVEISSDNGRYKLAGENATDFPKVPALTDTYSIDMSTDVLSSAIGNTIFATSNDELRPAMTGVYVKLDDTNTTFVATDGHRLVRYRRVDVASDTGMTIIIPRRALNLLKSTLPSENSNVIVEFSVSNAYFHFNNIKMICRLIDERFPDYENVIPTDNPIQMRIDRNELLGSLKRISIYANKTTHQIRLKITGSELAISAEDLDFSNEAKETLACEHDGEDIEIGFNAKFLVEMLGNVHSKEIMLQLSQPNRAGLIVPADQDESEDILMLVMPVMLNNYQQSYNEKTGGASGSFFYVEFWITCFLNPVRLLSKKTQYAFHALTYLAENLDKGPILISEISQERHISLKFLENILLELKKAGILGSKKGKGGGYYLIKNPEEVALAKIIRMLDGPIALLPCVSLNYYERCEHCTEEICGLNTVMSEVRDNTLKVLENKSLKDVLRKPQKFFLRYYSTKKVEIIQICNLNLLKDRKMLLDTAIKGKIESAQQSDSNLRSLLKTISWRVVGTIDTMIISYLITGNTTMAMSIGSVEVVSKMVLYFLHERAWSTVKLKRQNTVISIETIKLRVQQLSLADGLKEVAAMFPGQVVFSSAFGQEDQVITDAIFTNDTGVSVFTLDTGRLFKATYDLIDETRARYGKPIKTYFPNFEKVEDLVTQKGMHSFYSSVDNRKECCYVRKVAPLKRALKGNRVWVTGLRAQQSDNRQHFDIVEWDEANQIIKYNPLLHWSYDEMIKYLSDHRVPYNKLHDEGYVSIGCAPCTRAIEPGEDARAGRWWWESSKKECGLHQVSLEAVKVQCLCISELTKPP